MKYVFLEGKTEHPIRDTLDKVVQDVLKAGHKDWLTKGARKGRHGRQILGLREKVENAADTGEDQAVNG